MSNEHESLTEERDPGDALYEPWLFIKMLDELASSELGIGFVYAVLDVLVTRFGLDDATVVLADEALGTQAFRHGRRQADLDALPRGGLEPGVYTVPDIVPEVVRDAVRSVCQLALSLHLARYSAAHDALTNISNRRTFDSALHTATVQSSRYGWAFTLVLADLNALKAINDTAGHAVGDDVLRMFGFALRRSVRSGDTAARIGGDEFAVILANAEGGSEVDSFLERLRSLLVPSGIVIEFSVGTASAPRDSTDPAELYRIADARLYEKKGMIKR
ncbi:MAG TPA: GGDEF domain-containing protein [Acidimicrobiales bacterium]|nr:GGDEF domain-containing protein [Acidimicrobiales bacterium]